MAQELGGYGPTAGDYMGGSGSNLNERGNSGTSTGNNSSGGNGGNHGDKGGSGNGQPVVTAMAFGFPALAAPGVGGLAVTVSGDALSVAIAEVFALLKGPFKFGLWGVALYGVLPSEIAKDDPSMMSKIVMSLPADTVTAAPVGTLPLDQATVSLTKRVTDVIKDERQQIAVVAGVPMSVPVVDAKPTTRPGVFSASVPGLPDLQITSRKEKPVSTTLAHGITKESDKSTRYPGFTAGGNSHDVVIRFPAGSGQNPVYVSVTDVLTPEQIKLRQEEEKRRQLVWDATHPVEVAEREYKAALAELDAEDANIRNRQSELEALKKTPEALALSDAKTYPLMSKERKSVRVIGYSGGGAIFDVEATIDSPKKLGQLINLGGAGYVTDVLQFGQVTGPNEDGAKVGNAIRTELIAAYEKLRQRLLNRQNDIDRTQAALNAALESRKHKENKSRDAENKLNDEKGKPRKGTKDYGHDYHPAPKTEEIKGLDELKKGRKKTPKQGGGGLRDRWFGDKGRKIYEWDSQHGELEGYRASDGEHLGAFDPKTGKQVKSPDPKRNIKKYL